MGPSEKLIFETSPPLYSYLLYMQESVNRLIPEIISPQMQFVVSKRHTCFHILQCAPSSFMNKTLNYIRIVESQYIRVNPWSNLNLLSKLR